MTLDTARSVIEEPWAKDSYDCRWIRSMASIVLAAIEAERLACTAFRAAGQQGRGDSSIHSRPCLALGRAFKPSTRTRRLRYRDAQGGAPYDCLAYGIIIHSPDDLTLAGAQRSKNCALASQESSHIALHSDCPTCDRHTTSPGAFKQLRGSASPLRSDL